jgi:hypothetical protein
MFAMSKENRRNRRDAEGGCNPFRVGGAERGTFDRRRERSLTAFGMTPIAWLERFYLLVTRAKRIFAAESGT